VKAFNLLTSRRGLLVMAVIVWLFLLCPFAAAKAEQKSPKPQATATPAPATTPAPVPTVVPVPSAPSCIPVADVAAKTTEVANLLQAMTQKMAPRPQVEMIRELYSDLSKQIDQDMTGTMDILRQQPSLSLLQAHQQQWQQMQLKTTGWLTVLTKRSNELQNELDSLTDLQKTWETTLKASQDSKAPVPILQQIDQTLAAIKAAQTPLQARLTIVLDLQSSVSAEVAKCGMVLARIEQIQKTSMSGLFVRDGLPIVSPMLWAYSPAELLGRVVSIGAGYAADFSNYLQAPSEKRLLNIGLLGVLVLLFLACQREVRKWTAASETFSRDIRVFDHPIAAALSVTFLVATSPYWPLPTTVRVTFQILLFAPLLILVRPVVSTRLMPGLYILWLLFAIDATREVFSSDQLIGQLVLVAESLFGIVAMVWLLRKLKPVYGEAAGASRLRLLQTGVVILILILTAGLGAAAMGYMRLARLMTPGILVGGSLALALYASVRLLIGIVAVALHVWPLRTLRLVLHNRDKLEKKLYRVLIWLAITAWVVRYLSYIGMLELALSFGQAVLAAKFERGAISISPGGVLEFVLTVWAAYLLSAFIRFVLGEDVYPRMRIATGKSYAISSLLHYFILALGFTVAIAALGVNLSKLTVLTGAFGVGIGFGLQSVINNFVSGLILLFERPIHVGDTVEVGDLMGKVRSIGIRASTVHTRQGADIIVPNSQLISDKVTNWTLSDQLRRIDLPVGVNYSAQPGEVIKILVAVALANPNILKDPEPQGLFMGFGDSSINFELRAWTDRFDDWPSVRSELASAVYDAVYAAGMSFPFPQREVRLLSDAEGGTPAAAAGPVNEV
jgi:potassium-dependent mechanosensitive channel